MPGKILKQVQNDGSIKQVQDDAIVLLLPETGD